MLLTIITTVILDKQDHDQWCAHNLILLKATQGESSEARQKKTYRHMNSFGDNNQKTIWAFWWEMSCLHHPKWISQTLKLKGASPIVPLDKQPWFEKETSFSVSKDSYSTSIRVCYVLLNATRNILLFIYVHTWLLKQSNKFNTLSF